MLFLAYNQNSLMVFNEDTYHLFGSLSSSPPGSVRTLVPTYRSVFIQILATRNVG